MPSIMSAGAIKPPPQDKEPTNRIAHIAEASGMGLTLCGVPIPLGAPAQTDTVTLCQACAQKHVIQPAPDQYYHPDGM